MFTRNEITDPTALPSRRFYPWHQLEEYHPDGGMWRTPTASQRDQYITASADLMADPDAFADAMRDAARQWPKSTSVALTTPGLNQRAWIGHAGCFVATGSPEETTRLGWHQLDDGEQYAANAAADAVIREWRAAQKHCEQLPLGDWDA